jgi:hypothetical protein
MFMPSLQKNGLTRSQRSQRSCLVPFPPRPYRVDGNEKALTRKRSQQSQRSSPHAVSSADAVNPDSQVSGAGGDGRRGTFFCEGVGNGMEMECGRGPSAFFQGRQSRLVQLFLEVADGRPRARPVCDGVALSPDGPLCSFLATAVDPSPKLRGRGDRGPTHDACGTGSNSPLSARNERGGAGGGAPRRAPVRSRSKRPDPGGFVRPTPRTAARRCRSAGPPGRPPACR